jgi:hypothetical protein
MPKETQKRTRKNRSREESLDFIKMIEVHPADAREHILSFPKDCEK